MYLFQKRVSLSSFFLYLSLALLHIQLLYTCLKLLVCGDMANVYRARSMKGQNRPGKMAEIKR